MSLPSPPSSLRRLLSARRRCFTLNAVTEDQLESEKSFFSDFQAACERYHSNSRDYEEWLCLHKYIQEYTREIDSLETPSVKGMVTQHVNLFLKQTDCLIRDNYLTGTLLLLPQWLIDSIVMNPDFQLYLNERISHVGPSALLIFDFFFLVFTIFALYFVFVSVVDGTIDQDRAQTFWGILLSVAIYLGINQIVAFVAVARAGKYFIHFMHYGNVLMLLVLASIVSILVETAVFFQCELSPPGDNDGNDNGGFGCPTINISFYYGCAIFFVSLALVTYVCSFSTRMAGIMGGLISALPTILWVFFTIAILLTAFALIFEILLLSSDGKATFTDDGRTCEEIGETCLDSVSEMIFALYSTVSFGDVSRYSFSEFNDPQSVFFFLLMIHVVFFVLENTIGFIVAFNIRDRQTYLDFWSRRFLLVHRIDTLRIAFDRYVCFLWRKDSAGSGLVGVSEDKLGNFLANTWEMATAFYQKQDANSSWTDRLGVLLIRFVLAVFVVPVWFVAGLCTCGILWPYQIRLFLLAVKPGGGELQTDSDTVVEAQTVASKEGPAEASCYAARPLDEVNDLREQVEKLTDQIAGMEKTLEAVLMELRKG